MTALVLDAAFVPPDTPTPNTQNAVILRLLQAGEAVTPLRALEQAGCLRLAARISELRRQGYRITARTVTVDSGKRVSEYTLDNAASTR